MTSTPIAGTTEWQQIKLDFTVPEDTGRLQFELFSWQAAAASHWRDPTITVR